MILHHTTASINLSVALEDIKFILVFIGVNFEHPFNITKNILNLIMFGIINLENVLKNILRDLMSFFVFRKFLT